MMPVLEVSGQLHGGVHLLSGVLLKDLKRPVNFRGCAAGVRCPFELKDDSPPLNVASAGSSRSTSWGGCSCCQVSC